MAEMSHTSDASLLAGVLAAAEAALPGNGLDLLAWGASLRGDQATLRYLLTKGGKATRKFFDKPNQDHNIESDCQCVDSSRGHARVVADPPMSSVAANKTSFGADPLCFAAAKGDAGVVEALLISGADASTITNDGLNPLLVAAKAGHEAVVDKLLKAGVDVDKAAIDDGTTPLIEAIWNGHAGIVEQLLKSGADVNKAKTRDGSTPLLVASMKDRDEAIVDQLILAGADLDKARTDDGTTPLIMAAGVGNERIVARLLRAWPNPNKARTTGDGYTPLGMAAMDGNECIVKQLLQAGAWITTERGESALTLAAWEGHIGVCSLLLEAGADANHVSRMGEAALHVAVRQGHKETALLLVRHGASSAVAIIDKSMRQKLAKWLVQEMMQKEGAFEERKKLKAVGLVKRTTSTPCLKTLSERRRRSTVVQGCWV